MGVSMKTDTVRINDRTHQTLRKLAKQTGKSMPAMIDEAVERWRREQLLRDANAAWAAIIADPTARAEIEAERALWDGAAAQAAPQGPVPDPHAWRPGT